MLASFSVQNYRSVRDEQVLSFLATRDRSLPESVAEVNGERLLKTAAVFGANASGKSTLARALMEGSIWVQASARNPGLLGSGFDGFGLDASHRDDTTVLSWTLFIDGVRYEYSFAATGRVVGGETLDAWPNGRRQRWFSRTMTDWPEGADAPTYSWEFGPGLKGAHSGIQELTASTVLFLSMARHLEHGQLSKVANWFEGTVWVDPGHPTADVQLPRVAAELLLADE
jgi:hypothetical protein